MNITPADADVAARARAYAAAVGAELADLPYHQVAAVLDGLVDHLLEPGELSEHLVDDLPAPSQYAAELRASLPDAAPPPTTPSPPATTAVPRAPVGALAGVAIALAGVVVVVGLAIAGALALRTVASSEPRPAPPTAAPTAEAPESVVVPDVVAVAEDEAVAELEAAGLSVVVLHPPTVTGTVPSGVVVEMEPAPGSAVAPGAEVLVVVAP